MGNGHRQHPIVELFPGFHRHLHVVGGMAHKEVAPGLLEEHRIDLAHAAGEILPLHLCRHSGGPAGPLCAVAGPDGAVKVTIENPELELQLKPNGKLDVGGALGKDGQLTIMRSFGYGEPYVGRVNLVSGEIAEDFAMYYLESEQTPSLCALGTLVGEEILSAGGILIQAMPGCSEELLDALELRSELFSAISQLLMDMTLEEIVSGCFRGLEPEILEEIPLTLRCDCSHEYIERVLLSMGEAEIRDLIRTQNGCEVTCHFCRSHYAFTGEELEQLIIQGKSDSDE